MAAGVGIGKWLSYPGYATPESNTLAVLMHSALRQLGRYELISKIGSGGMAEVFIARQSGLMNFEKVVVVKTIHEHLSLQEEFISMLLDEARLSALIKHPGVVDIYDLGEANGTYFIAMEYLAGQSLTKVMTEARNRKLVLDVLSTLRIIADAAAALHAAHDLKSMTGEFLGLVHRDISPGNIIVLYDGNVKIVDFGVAKAQSRMTITAPLQIKGKLGYIAPEQMRGDDVDRRADIFALGVVMWELLTYRRLFKANPAAASLDKLREGVVCCARSSPSLPDGARAAARPRSRAARGGRLSRKGGHRRLHESALRRCAA